MKYFIDSICPPILVIIGIIIFWPPKPEPICPACGVAFNLLFSKVAATAYLGIGVFGTYLNVRDRLNVNRKG